MDFSLMASTSEQLLGKAACSLPVRVLDALSGPAFWCAADECCAIERNPSPGSEESLLARPNNPCDPLDIAGRNRAVGMVRIERLQLQCLGGPAFQLPDHHFAGPRFHHHAGAAPDRRARRTPKDTAAAVR